MTEGVLVDQIDLTGGVNLRNHPELLHDSELQIGDNVRIVGLGELRNRWGSRVMRISQAYGGLGIGDPQPKLDADGGMRGLYRFYPRDYSPLSIAAYDNQTGGDGRCVVDADRDGNFLDESGAAVLSGLTTDAIYDFASFENLCILVNGKDTPKAWNAANGAWESLSIARPSMASLACAKVGTGTQKLPDPATFDYRFTTGLMDGATVLYCYQSGPSPNFTTESTDFRVTTDASNKAVSITGIPNPGSGKCIHIYRARVWEAGPAEYYRIKTLTAGESSYTDDGSSNVSASLDTLDRIDNWGPPDDAS
jgi:hypothetical protein